jgi:mRNA interferase RelE/StbE
VAKVILARRARQQLLNLDWTLADAVADALGLLERDPDSGYPLRGRLQGLRSLRVGTYRIIYQIADDHQTVRSSQSRTIPAARSTCQAMCR